MGSTVSNQAFLAQNSSEKQKEQIHGHSETHGCNYTAPVLNQGRQLACSDKAQSSEYRHKLWGLSWELFSGESEHPKPASTAFFPELLSWIPRLNKCLLLHWLLQETAFPSKLLILTAQSEVNSRENTCCSVWKINSWELQLHKSPGKRLTMKTLHSLVRNQFAFQTEERK